VGAKHEVAALPGGQALADLADKVDGAQPEAIRRIAKHWTEAATRCGECDTAVKNSVARLDGAWHGASADGFVSYMAGFGKAGASLQEALSNAAGDLNAAADALESAKTSVDNICERLLGQVRQYRAQHEHDSPDEQNAAVQELCAEAAADARPKVAEADHALADALGKLNGHAAAISPRFSSLADPNTQAFVPAPGRAVDWQPTAAPPQITDPQGSGGTPGAPTSGGAPGTGDAFGAGGGGGYHTAATSGGSDGGGYGGSGYGGGGGGGGGDYGGGGGDSGGPPSPGVAAPSGQVKDWIEQAIEILREQGVPVDKMSPDQIWAIIQHESGGNPHAINNWDCVPLSTMILTRRGWLKHDEVEVGDETIGYRPETGRSEWTRVTRVVHHSDARLVRLENTRWHATTTPNHRWLNLSRQAARAETLPDSCWLCEWPEGTRRRGKTTNGGLRIHLAKVHGVAREYRGSTCLTTPEFVATADVRSRDRLLLAAPADTDARLDVSVQEAAVLGWIAGEGHVEKRQHRPTASIAQSKPPMVAKLKILLGGIPHAQYVDDRGSCGLRHQFRLGHDYVQDLFRRAGNPKSSAVEQVLAMSTDQREAWLEAIIDAEGHRGGQGTVVYQRPGAVLDAIALATYLSGRRPRVLRVRRGGDHNWAPEAAVRGNNPIITGEFLGLNDAGRGDVWCVTTELGTWTAREDDHIFLTGNSNAAAGHPSKGLMQTIDSTFNSYKLPGHDDIWNPVDNIIAGIRYSIARYGSVANVPGIQSMQHGGAYRGY
jgi:WXG100 family type VII secretion target